MELFIQIFPTRVQEVFHTEILNHTVGQIFAAMLAFVVMLGFVRVFRKIILQKLQAVTEKTKTNLDNVIFKIIKRIPRIFYWTLAAYFTVKFFFDLGEIVQYLDSAIIILVMWQIVRFSQAVAFYMLDESSFGENKTSLQGIKLIANIILWSVAILMVLSNIGFDVTALMASLGIGGIAVALAAQNILGDLFSSFTIYFDKPFEVGDYIVIGNHSGIVRKIGLKTTRIQTLQGEELVVSNRELTESRVQNFKQLERRRIDFVFGVTYETSAENLRKIPEIVSNLIEELENASLLRVYMKNFADSSLEFSAAYFVESSDYEIYARTHHEVTIGLLERFRSHGIGMAYPTRTVYMKKVE